MGLPGPVLDAPATLWFVEEGRRRRDARMLDAGGQTLAQLATNWRGDRSIELDGTHLLLRSRGVVRAKVTVLDAGGAVLVHAGGAKVSADGQTFELREGKGRRSAPWALGPAGAEIATGTPPTKAAEGARVEVTGARPVALLVLIACCEWERRRTMMRA